MKWLEQDYVTGDWYFLGISLNPNVWLGVLVLIATRPATIIGAFGGMCFLLGKWFG